MVVSHGSTVDLSTLYRSAKVLPLTSDNTMVCQYVASPCIPHEEHFISTTWGPAGDGHARLPIFAVLSAAAFE